LGIAAALPILASAGSIPGLIAGLLMFGASIGAIDVAVNIHGTMVQEKAGVSLMSNFHGMYSVGGVAGSAGMTVILASGIPPHMAAWMSVAVVLACLLFSAPRLLGSRSAGDTPFFVIPRGIVILIGLLAFALFLVEGAMLDWSAVLLEGDRGISKEKAGIGFVLFSLAMTVGRFAGDSVTQALGGRKILAFGAMFAAAGLGMIVFAPWNPMVLAGFIVTGLGAANMVPVLFTAAGRQKTMPPALAIAAVSALGYLGVLAGPASLGFIAKSISLPGVFVVLAVMILMVGAMAKVARD
jgi:fucose permease